jgi:hypothetical protein
LYPSRSYKSQLKNLHILVNLNLTTVEAYTVVVTTEEPGARVRHAQALNNREASGVDEAIGSKSASEERQLAWSLTNFAFCWDCKTTRI